MINDIYIHVYIRYMYKLNFHLNEALTMSPEMGLSHSRLLGSANELITDDNNNHLI